MASKGQKFRKWSYEEKLRIVKRHTEDHVSVNQLPQRSVMKPAGYLAIILRTNAVKMRVFVPKLAPIVIKKLEPNTSASQTL